jgi:pimeloyl-ACP methyl ester carboxylesterase
MKTKASWLVGIVILLGSALAAQDIGGNWQGVLDQGQQQMRFRLTIEKTVQGGWTGKLHQADGQDWGSFLEVPITVQGTDVKFTVARMRSTFEGRINTDGNSIQGTWTRDKAVPLTFDRTTPATEWKDPAHHTIQFVTVDKDVKLEVLDYGGTGRPLVFLAGGGNSAHVWDTFAPKFTSAYHVYAITRRGTGDSSAPSCGYEANRMGDDVIAVLDALKLERPVLAGHSIAGEELSSVGSRHPERVAGLIYLDSGDAYAYYDSKRGDVLVDSMDLRNKLLEVQVGQSNARDLQLIQEIIAEMPQVKKELEELQKELSVNPTREGPPLAPSVQRMIPGVTKYTKVPVPVLALYAFPPDPSPGANPTEQSQTEIFKAYMARIADSFEKGVPTARVVRIPNAQHYIFRSNEAEVIREMNAFLAGLK